MIFVGDDMDYDYIDRLTALRQDRDIGQKVIAGILGCKQSTVSKYELRRSRYEIDDLIKLCKFYHVSADYILGLPKGMEYPER
jgi:transcriptional regulator with XRE-family HTH domain